MLSPSFQTVQGLVPSQTQTLSKAPELPWLDYASAAMPTDHYTVLWWAQYLWVTNDTYRQAMNRVAEHFVTELAFPELESDEENELKEFFTKHLNYRVELPALAHDFQTYGNVFMSVYLPFRRMMRCKHCGQTVPIADSNYRLELTAQSPYVVWHKKKPCQNCGDSRPYECVDLKDMDLSKVKIITYSPFEIKIAYNRNSKEKRYWWRIDAEDKRDILSGAPVFVETTPLEVLEAVARNGDLEFEDGAILHCDERVISGIKTRGWGMPRAIASFRSAWLNQIINKADQAVAKDYTLGMRIISPAQVAGAGNDPMQTHGMQNFAARMQSIIEAHRIDPTKFHTAPYPLQYQFMGGEGATLVPPEKLKFRQQEFLNGMGIPLEYHQMSLSVQAAPMALRLFEASWQHIPDMYNRILGWVVGHLVKHFGLKSTSVVMQRSTIADDMMRKQVLTQLMAANQISPQTALEVFGIDARDEVRKVYKHQDFVAKVQQEYDEKAQKQQEMGAVHAMSGMPTASTLANQVMPPPGGAPMPGGGVMQAGMPPGGGGLTGQPQSIPEMSGQAEQMAQQLVSMPEYERKQQLRSIRESNKDLHALVTSAMDRIRRGAASQGQQMVLQQGAPQ